MTDLGELVEATRLPEAQRLFDEETMFRFDLADGPLVSISVAPPQ